MAYALRGTKGTGIKYSPAEILFGREVLIHQSSIIDWNLLQNNKWKQQMKANERENSKMINHKWKVGNQCLVVTKPKERTGKLLGCKHKGPYKVKKVRNNGTIEIDGQKF